MAYNKKRSNKLPTLLAITGLAIAVTGIVVRIIISTTFPKYYPLNGIVAFLYGTKGEPFANIILSLGFVVVGVVMFLRAKNLIEYLSEKASLAYGKIRSGYSYGDGLRPQRSNKVGTRTVQIFASLFTLYFFSGIIISCLRLFFDKSMIY